MKFKKKNLKQANKFFWKKNQHTINSDQLLYYKRFSHYLSPYSEIFRYMDLNIIMIHILKYYYGPNPAK
jgi:hypothetical protein